MAPSPARTQRGGEGGGSGAVGPGGAAGEARGRGPARKRSAGRQSPNDQHAALNARTQSPPRLGGAAPRYSESKSMATPCLSQKVWAMKSQSWTCIDRTLMKTQNGKEGAAGRARASERGCGGAEGAPAIGSTAHRKQHSRQQQAGAAAARLDDVAQAVEEVGRHAVGVEAEELRSWQGAGGRGGQGGRWESLAGGASRQGARPPLRAEAEDRRDEREA